jgi:hypothetical protein
MYIIVHKNKLCHTAVSLGWKAPLCIGWGTGCERREEYLTHTRRSPGVLASHNTDFTITVPNVTLFYSVVKRPNSGLGCLIVGFVDETYTHTSHLVGLLWMSDKLVTEVDTYSTHTSQKSIPSVGFEPLNLAVECPQTYDLDQHVPNFFQVGTTFISQNVLRSPLLLSPLKANCLRFSTAVCDTQFTLILFFLSFLD